MDLFTNSMAFEAFKPEEKSANASDNFAIARDLFMTPQTLLARVSDTSVDNTFGTPALAGGSGNSTSLWNGGAPEAPAAKHFAANIKPMAGIEV